MKREEVKKKNDFRIKLAFKVNDVIMIKEESVLTKKLEVFTRDKILPHHKVLEYFIDLYFPDYQLAIEVDARRRKKRKKQKKN